MKARLFWTAFSALLVISSAAGAQDQQAKVYSRQDFINVDGASFQDKVSKAVQMFKASKQGESFWIAYHFAAREGTSIGPFSGSTYYDEDGIRLRWRDNPGSAAVFLLTEVGGSRSNFTRVKTLAIDEPYEFENRPVYWLGDVDTGQSIDELEALMRANPDNKLITRGALRAIAAHNSSRAIPILKQIASNDSDAEAQRSAIANLGRIRSTGAIETLEDLLEHSGSSNTKVEILRAYVAAGRDVGEKRVLDRLTATAKSDDLVKVRGEAIRLIASFRGEAIAERLIEIYDGTSSDPVKEEIIARFSQSSDRKALGKLLAIAKSDPNPRLRQLAVRRLSSSRAYSSLF